jgi:hypothetical protein
MVLTVSKANANGMMFLNIAVDPGVPKRWREKAWYERIKKMAVAGVKHKVLVRVSSKGRQWIVLPDRDVEVPDDVAGFDILQDALGKWNLRFRETV